MGYLQNTEFVLAFVRKTTREVFNLDLKDEDVVHHKDGSVSVRLKLPGGHKKLNS